MTARRRVLVTGADHGLGARVTARLEREESVEELVGVYRDTPPPGLERTELVRADLRHDLLGRIIRGLAVDTVVHLDLLTDPRSAGGRAAHERNLIGSLNLVAACGADTAVRRVVLRSSTAAYGCAWDDPAFIAEGMRRREPAADTFSRDLEAVEEEVADLAARRPGVEVTVLRLGNVVGPESATPFRALLQRRAVPVVAGFDPRLQLLHEDDAVEALLRCTLDAHPGVFNVTGPGVMVLSQMVAACGGVRLPVIPPGPQAVMRAALRAWGLPGWSGHLLAQLQYGQAVDTSRIEAEVGGIRPTREVVRELAAWPRAAAAAA